jgi:hypothetical protein
MNICTVKGAFEVLVALSALGAAGWWFAASWIARGSFLETVIAEFDHIQRNRGLMCRCSRPFTAWYRLHAGVSRVRVGGSAHRPPLDATFLTISIRRKILH